MARRILRILIEIPADVTPGADETQEEADAATAVHFMPALVRALGASASTSSVTFAGSNERG